MHFKPELPEFQKKAKVAIEGAIENPTHFLSPFQSPKDGCIFSLTLPASIIAAPFLLLTAVATAALAIIGLVITLTAFCIQTAHSCLKPQDIEMHAYFKLKTIYAALFTAVSILSTLILPVAAIIAPFASFGLLCLRSINTLTQCIQKNDEKEVDVIFNEMNDVDSFNQSDHSLRS